MGRVGSLSKLRSTHHYSTEISESKRGAPMRKIVRVLVSYSNIFSQDIVELECGHTVNSNAIHRAHCPKCKKEQKP